LPDSRNCRPVSSSRGVRLLFRARPRRVRPSFRSPQPARLRAPARSGNVGSTSPGVLAPVETPLRRVPLLARTVLKPSGKTKVARPSPVPSSGFLPLSTVQAAHAALHEPLRSPPFRRGAPTLRGLLTCRSRLFGAALQSFPFPRSRACSRRPLLPCGFALRPPPARHDRDLHGRFPRRASSLPRAHPEVNRDA